MQVVARNDQCFLDDGMNIWNQVFMGIEGENRDMKCIKMIILGAGGRGNFVYGDYALANPDKAKVVAVAEPDAEKRKIFARKHQLDEEHIFNSWDQVFKLDKFADVVCVCTQDRMHVAPAVAAMELGYDIILEKPVAPTAKECKYLDAMATKYGVSVGVAHVLRYTPFFCTIKKALEAGEIGRLRGIQHNENIGHIHFSHSFVRGNWRNEETSSPMILAKSCHDMDILLYLVGKDCTDLASYGSKGTFSAKNRPADAPDRCLDGCPHAESCPYYGPRIYLNGNVDWPVNILTTDCTPSGITKALQTGPYGRCVYACDNDMTEQQAVTFRFEDDVTAVFTMSAFTDSTTRTIKLMGEKGEIRGNMERNEVSIFDFETNQEKVIHIKMEGMASGHAGGDSNFIADFLTHEQDKALFPLKTSLHLAIQSHLMAFAAHQSMLTNKAVNLQEFAENSN